MSNRPIGDWAEPADRALDELAAAAFSYVRQLSSLKLDSAADLAALNKLRHAAIAYAKSAEDRR